jgi:hypothetical protein
MASTVYLPVGSLLYVDTSATDTPTWVKLSEHNRQPMSIGQNRIQKVTRMSNGTLRKFFIADKREFSTSWNMLPSFSNMTVDAGYGALDLKSYFEGTKGQGTFKIKIVYGKNQTTPFADREEIFTVSFTSCSFEVIKRNVKDSSSDPAQEFWNVSIAMEQV